MRLSVRLSKFRVVPFLAPALAAGFSGCGGTAAVEPASAAVKLAFTVQPANTNTGSLISPAIQVAAQDVNGNTVGGYSAKITVTLAANPSGDTLAGTTTINAYLGVAAFTNLSVRRIGSGYTLMASADGLTSATSSAFSTSGWADATAMPTRRSGLSAAYANGLIYAMGGTSATGTLLATVEAYDPVSGTWSAKAPMPRARSHFAVGVVNGLVYAVGGLTAAGLTATVDVYDPVGDTWTTVTSMPTAREDLGVAFVNGILYAVGGTSTTQPPAGTGEVEAYDPAGDSWTVKTPLTIPRRDLAVAAIGGTLYAVGGNPGSSLGGVTVEAYDPPTDTWITKASLPVARAALGACVTNGILYAVGGVATGVSGMVTSYDPTMDAWTLRAPMLTARQYLGVACVGASIYAVGGSQGSTGPTTATESLLP